MRTKTMPAKKRALVSVKMDEELYRCVKALAGAGGQHVHDWLKDTLVPIVLRESDRFGPEVKRRLKDIAGNSD